MLKPLELKVGKLYCVREDPLTAWNIPYDAYSEPYKRHIVFYIDTARPFLVVDIKLTDKLANRKAYKVLYGERAGWIEFTAKNPVEEIG